MSQITGSSLMKIHRDLIDQIKERTIIDHKSIVAHTDCILQIIAHQGVIQKTCNVNTSQNLIDFAEIKTNKGEVK